MCSPVSYVVVAVAVAAAAVAGARGHSFAGLRGKDAGVLCQNTFHYSLASKPPQTGKSPFSVVAHLPKYIPGKNLQVSIVGPEQIHGIILQARRFGTTSIVGAFVAPHGGVHSTHNCDGVNDTIITWYGKVTTNVTYTWLPSDDATGTIQFVAMVFTKDDVYWENVTSRRIRKGFTSIDLSKCGKEKGCFRYISGAKDCDANTCEYLLTYEREGNLANFELSAKADWVAVGFSSDDRMGGDDVLMCVRTRRDAEVRHYFTNYNHVPPTLMSSNPLFNKQVEVTDDGRVSCRFSRPMKVDNDQFSVDLNNDWWQFYAWGPVSSGGAIMRHSLESPPASDFKITLSHRRNVISAASDSGAVLCIFPIVCLIHVMVGALHTGESYPT